MSLAGRPRPPSASRCSSWWRRPSPRPCSVSELAAAGVTWRGDPEEAHGLDVGDLPAALPGWVGAPLGLLVLLSALFAPLLALVRLPGSTTLAATEWARTRRLAPLTVAAVVLSAALAALVLAWGAEMTVWLID